MVLRPLRECLVAKTMSKKVHVPPLKVALKVGDAVMLDRGKKSEVLTTITEGSTADDVWRYDYKVAAKSGWIGASSGRLRSDAGVDINSFPFNSLTL